MTSALFILGGVVLLVGGGETLVRGAVGLAARLGLSPTVIGLTIVGFGTSMPELLTSLSAALAGAPGIAVGNVVGSNIANVLLILGAAALLAPMTGGRSLTRDLVTMAGASVLLLGVVLTGDLGRLAGLALALSLAAYLWLVFRSPPVDSPKDIPPAPAALPLALCLFAGGLLVTVLGARLLVTGAVDVAEALGVSDVVIGLTIVAVGTSLPELVTSLVAARKGESGLALGNVIGSSIFNILGILGITAIVSPLTVPGQILQLDIWVMLGASALLCALPLFGWRIGRGMGGAFLTAYAAYLAALVWLA